MATDSTADTRFLTELVRRADHADTHNITGHDICEHLEISTDQADAVVRRLLSRGLVEEIRTTRKLGGKQGRFNIRPTPEAYKIVGHGLTGN